MASASTRNAVKRLIEGLDLGLAVFEDRRPSDDVQASMWPYATVVDASPVVAGGLEDGRQVSARETVFIDIWQHYRDAGGNRGGSETLVPALLRGLSGARPRPLREGTRYQALIYTIVLRDSRRVPDPDRNVIHDAITVEVVRQL